MEQRIGSNSQPLDAGVDPAYIPGLTSPASAEPEDAAEPEGTEEAEDVVEPEEAAPPAAAAEEESEKEPDKGPEKEPDEELAPDGPVFEASDRRAKIVADHKGVRLRLDDQACEFRWDEVGAIETESPRFGKRFTITVHTPDRRWYPIEIEATARARFEEWESQLDEVLDAYFEDGEDAAADAGKDADDDSD
ncbi:hypothetical protein [Streptomyces sporangiiformans]|uniref:Uncharacterized protein n=1 Tax=Streptomyces sporangiiformans TaxID=2315329 RepID=A0A505DD11_9ACTN|nr:hypothetical protein [Streptomyces sporangiiformans]TPQ19625.1 hypothetical protein FGD71_024680 [Streptomyces sporangiiformans]